MATSAPAMPSVPAKKTFKIYVGNLNPDIDSPQLKGVFLAYNCTHAHVFTNGQQSLGYGIVVFDTEDDMYTAIEAMDGRVIAGKALSIKVFKSVQQQQQEQRHKGKVGEPEEVNRLNVSFFPRSTNEKDVESFLGEFNPISVELHKCERGSYAAVEFASEKDMNDAFEFIEKTSYNNKKLNVRYEKNKKII